MTRDNAKKLLASGVLQAYAEGKTIEVQEEGTWIVWKEVNP